MALKWMGEGRWRWVVVMLKASASAPKVKTIKSMDEKLMKFGKLNETYVFV